MLAEPGLAGRGVAAPPLGDQPVDLGHEGVEVLAPLALHRRGLEEQVHQQRLAASDRAPQVDPPGGPRLCEEIQPGGLSLDVQGLFELRQRRQGRVLAGVGLDLAALELAAVRAGEGFRHGLAG